MPDTTRRDFLLSGFGAISGVVGLDTFNAVRQNGSQWDIGLPLQEGWSAQVRGSYSYSPVGVTSNHQLVVVAEGEFRGQDDRLYLIDIETGAEELISTFSENVFSGAVNDRTILVSLPREVVALDTKGNELWRDNTTYEEPYFVSDYDRGFLYLGSTTDETDYDGDQVGYYSRGRLAAVSIKGDRLFTKDFGFATTFWTTEDSIIVKVTSQTYMGEKYEVTDGHILCIGFDGTERWRANTGPPKQIYVRDSQVIVATTDGAFEILDSSSGKRTEAYDTGSPIDEFAVGNGHIYYQQNDHFKSIDIRDGSEKWSIFTNGDIYDISFREGALYTGWESGRFDMRNPTDGTVIWEQSSANEDDSSGYEWIGDGRLFTFYGGTIRCFFGQKAIAIDYYRRLTTHEELAIGSRLNQFINGGKLSKAEEAIEDGQYQVAIQTLDKVSWWLTGINTTLGLTVFGSLYAVSRKSVSSIRRRQFEKKVGQLQEEYPISEGGLEGLAPHETLSQAGVALEARDSGILGDRLRSALDDVIQQNKLEVTISKYNKISPQLTRLSRRLANLDPSDDVRQKWAEELRACIKEPDTLSDRSESIDELLSQYHSWQEQTNPTFEFAGEQIDTDAVKRAFQAAGQKDADGSAAARTYVAAAAEFVGAVDENGETLSGYTLSAVLDVTSRALSTEPSSYEGAAQSLTESADLIQTAAEAERSRQSLSLDYTDESKTNLKKQLQEAISDLHLSRVHELEEYIDHLASGTWQLHQLTSLSATEFEELVGRFYSAQGYSTQVTRQSADRGIDVIARGGGEMLAIQAKRYTGSNRVGRPAVQKIVGAATQAGADRAVVVTTSGFTNAATTAAREFGRQVELIDGDALVKLLTNSPLSPPQSSGSRRTATSSDRSGAEREHQRRGQSAQNQSQQARCDACGELFSGELTKVTLPDGSSGYCCPRCEQIIDETIGTTKADTRDAAVVLDISPDASKETIEAAYRERVKECHPDASDGDREEFLRVQEAYETLKNW